MMKKLYRIRFINEDKVYEIYARHVFQGELYGFVMVEDLVFDETSEVVVDPQQEKLKHEFEGVKQTCIPMHAIVRIDQVEKQGTARITAAGDNVTRLPRSPVYTPGGGE
jgi:hypothetical protein